MAEKKTAIYKKQQKKLTYFYRFFRNNVFDHASPFKVYVKHNWIESGAYLIKSFSTEATIYSTSSELDSIISQ